VLNRFWGDLEPGGRVFVHDYLGRGTPGVRKACDEFAVERGLNPWKILVPSEYGIVSQLRGNNNQGGEHA
jgi:hypothetical protein